MGLFTIDGKILTVDAAGTPLFDDECCCVDQECCQYWTEFRYWCNHACEIGSDMPVHGSVNREHSNFFTRTVSAWTPWSPYSPGMRRMVGYQVYVCIRHINFLQSGAVFQPIVDEVRYWASTKAEAVQKVEEGFLCGEASETFAPGYYVISNISNTRHGPGPPGATHGTFTNNYWTLRYYGQRHVGGCEESRCSEERVTPPPMSAFPICQSCTEQPCDPEMNAAGWLEGPGVPWACKLLIDYEGLTGTFDLGEGHTLDYNISGQLFIWMHKCHYWPEYFGYKSPEWSTEGYEQLPLDEATVGVTAHRGQFRTQDGGVNPTRNNGVVEILVQAKVLNPNPSPPGSYWLTPSEEYTYHLPGPILMSSFAASCETFNGITLESEGDGQTGAITLSWPPSS